MERRWESVEKQRRKERKKKENKIEEKTDFILINYEDLVPVRPAVSLTVTS